MEYIFSIKIPVSITICFEICIFSRNLARRCEIRDSDLENWAEIRVSLAESSARGRRDAGAELQSKIPVRGRRCQFLHQKVHWKGRFHFIFFYKFLNFVKFSKRILKFNKIRKSDELLILIIGLATQFYRKIRRNWFQNTGWWSYEVCKGKVIRQRHGAKNEADQVENSLGIFAEKYNMPEYTVGRFSLLVVNQRKHKIFTKTNAVCGQINLSITK